MTNSLKVALCAVLTFGSVQSGYAASPSSYYDQVKDLAGKAGSTLTSAGYQALTHGAYAARWSMDQALGAYKAIADTTGVVADSASAKWSHMHQSLSSNMSHAYGLASHKAVSGLNWAAGKTPEGVKEFVTNHPYLTGIAIVAPLALIVGYKLCKPKKAQKSEPQAPVQAKQESRTEKKPHPVLVLKLKEKGKKAPKNTN